MYKCCDGFSGDPFAGECYSKMVSFTSSALSDIFPVLPVFKIEANK